MTQHKKANFKKLLATSCMLFGCVFGAAAQSNTTPKNAQKRAQHLTRLMVEDLKLNNYQTSKLSQINLDIINKMVEIEGQYANNTKLAEISCKTVCRERDRELEEILSTKQYSEYFGKRRDYFKYDKLYAANPNISDQELAEKVKNEIRNESMASRIEKGMPQALQHPALVKNNNASSGSGTSTAANVE